MSGAMVSMETQPRFRGNGVAWSSDLMGMYPRSTCQSNLILEA